MNRPDHEIDAYLDGQPTPEQLRTLEAWIQADPAHAASFLSAVQMHHQVGQRLMKARLSEKLADAKPVQAASSDSSVFAAEVLEALKQLEQDSADAELQHLPAAGRPRRGRAPEDKPANSAPPITAGDIVGVSGYLLRKLATSRPVLYAAAAAVAMGVCVMLIVQAGKTPTDPAAPATAQTPEAITPVATLTKTHHAKWVSQSKPAGDLRRGALLHPGQTLTLTHGFAEITTNDGSVAILEAPVTIELLDNDNAIYLHAGKLVGICETKRSKGFLVRTPHLDIIDFGTRFGVDTSAGGATEVHVFTGSVQATRPTKGAQPLKRVLLQTGEAIRASDSGDGLVVVQSDKQRFAAIGLADMRLLRGTGQGLSTGAIDPRWQVVAIGGDLLDEPVAMRVSDRLFNSNQLARAVSGAKYLILRKEIVPDIADYIVDKRIRYTIQTTLHLPVDFDPAKADLVIQFEADDRLSMVRVNGRETAAPANRFVLEDPKLYRVIIPGSHLKPGPNAVELKVSDLIRSNSYAWGFGVAWHLEAIDKEQP